MYFLKKAFKEKKLKNQNFQIMMDFMIQRIFIKKPVVSQVKTNL